MCLFVTMNERILRFGSLKRRLSFIHKIITNQQRHIHELLKGPTTEEKKIIKIDLVYLFGVVYE